VAVTRDPEDRAEQDAAEALDVQAELVAQGAVAVQAAVDPQDTVVTAAAATVLVAMAVAKVVVPADPASQVKVVPRVGVPPVVARALLVMVNVASGSPAKADRLVHRVMVNVVSGSPAKTANAVVLVLHAMARSVSGSLVRVVRVTRVLHAMVNVASGNLVKVVTVARHVTEIVARHVTEIVARAHEAVTVTVPHLAAMAHVMNAPN
jgi:hypothetical protein